MQKLQHILIIAGMGFLFHMGVFAETDDPYLLSESTYNALNQINELIAEEKFSAALSETQNLKNKIENNAYESAILQQTLGYIYNGLENYPKAIDAFKQAVDSGALPPEVNLNLYQVLAQLLIHAEDYQTGLDYLEKWLAKTPQPGVDMHMLAAIAYYKSNQLKAMLDHVKTAIKISDTPQQNWYDLLLTGYLGLKQYSEAARLLEDMINRYPQQKDYWFQLIAVYHQLKQEDKALALNELAYSQAWLTRDQILQLAQSYLYLDLPMKAATLLKQRLASGQLDVNKQTIDLLVSSLITAREIQDAAATLEQYINQLGEPDLYYRLGHLYVELEAWQKAVAALEKFIEKQSPQKHNAWLLLGIASYHSDNNKRAIQALQQAAKNERHKDTAEWWLNRIQQERASEIEQESLSGFLKWPGKQILA